MWNFSSLVASRTPPSLHVHLTAAPEVALRRVESRCRTREDNLSPEYLLRVSRAFDRVAEENGYPVVDTTAATPEEAAREVKRIVLQRGGEGKGRGRRRGRVLNEDF